MDIAIFRFMQRLDYVQFGTAAGRCVGDSPRMSSPTIGDVILRGSIDGAFTVLEAKKGRRVAGPLAFHDAVTYARAHGARKIFQQVVDERGRIMGDPSRVVLNSA
jgi:hypothetical protein